MKFSSSDMKRLLLLLGLGLIPVALGTPDLLGLDRLIDNIACRRTTNRGYYGECVPRSCCASAAAVTGLCINAEHTCCYGEDVCAEERLRYPLKRVPSYPNRGPGRLIFCLIFRIFMSPAKYHFDNSLNVILASDKANLHFAFTKLHFLKIYFT